MTLNHRRRVGKWTRAEKITRCVPRVRSLINHSSASETTAARQHPRVHSRRVFFYSCSLSLSPRLSASRFARIISSIDALLSYIWHLDSSIPNTNPSPCYLYALPFFFLVPFFFSRISWLLPDRISRDRSFRRVFRSSLSASSIPLASY